jgi:RND family efflux transporter MFP subunit
MATISVPQKKTRPRWLMIGGVIVALLAVVSIALSIFGATTTSQSTNAGWIPATAETGTIDAAISSTGNVAARSQAELRFVANGTVSKIFVKTGDTITAGQPLAQIESAADQFKVDAAEAELTQAQAALDKLNAGATAEEIKEADSKVAQAQAAYDQTVAKVTSADVAAARAKLEQAQIQLNTLRAAASPDRRDEAAQLERSKLALQSERDRLSQAKTNAKLALDQAVADLARAQQQYATANGNWDFVKRTGQDPTDPDSPNPEKPGERIPNKLSDTQRQQYYDAFIAAQSAMRSAEASVEQARVEYDSARQAEVTGVQTAEQQLASAQAGFDKARNNEPANLADARATVASAQADLHRLLGASRASEIASAQASLDAAILAREKLGKGATPADRTRAQAELARAEANLNQAQLTLTQTTLIAPFDATIARIDLRIGEQTGTNGIIAVVDMRSFQIDVAVDELDIAQIEAGQRTTITLDALRDTKLSGTVTTISPLAAKSSKGTNTYAVTVAIATTDPAIKPGMTANVRLITASQRDVVIVPRRAIQTEAGQTFVYVPFSDAANAPTDAPGQRVPITIGLSNPEFVEVTTGLKAGETVLLPDIVQTMNITIN